MKFSQKDIIAQLNVYTHIYYFIIFFIYFIHTSGCFLHIQKIWSLLYLGMGTKNTHHHFHIVS